MKRIIFALCTFAAAVGAAHAQQVSITPPLPTPAMPLRFMVGMGVSGGGDKLASARYTDGSHATLHAGGLVYFTAGLDYRVTPAFSLQWTVNYHVDQANASNGDIKFQRFPVEMLGYYQATPTWRIGGGVRYSNSPKLKSSGVASGLDTDYDSSAGAVIESEWFASRNVGVKLRYVNEKFKEHGYYGYGAGSRYSRDIDGSHVGLSANLYF